MKETQAQGVREAAGAVAARTGGDGALAATQRQARRGVAGRTRYRRQGRRHRSHRRASQSASAPPRRAAETFGPRAGPMVFPALRRAPARRGRDHAVRPQLVQPRRRRAGDGLRQRGPGQDFSRAGAGFRTAAGRRWHRAVQVLAVHGPGAAGSAFQRTAGRSAQALEAVADRCRGTQAVRRLHHRPRGDAAGHAYRASRHGRWSISTTRGADA